MAFNVCDVRDLTGVLAMHPEWLGEVRRLVLTAEILTLPGLVQELAHAQARTEQRVAELAEAQARTERRVIELAEAQVRTERRVIELAEAQARTERRVIELAEAQVRTEERLDALAARVDALTVRVDALTARVDALTARVDALTARVDALAAIVQELVQSQKQIVNTIGGMKGRLLEITYRERAVAYFGRLLRRPKVVSMNDLWEKLETELSRREFDDLLSLDLLVQGRPRDRADAGDILLAVEVSSVVDRGDVERAQRRAALLRKAGYRSAPLVAGEAVTQGATELLQNAPAVLLLDGSSDGWEAALDAWYPQAGSGPTQQG